MTEILNKGINFLKGKMVRGTKNNRPPIIIAGLGRCGTTLVYESLKKNHHYNYLNELFLFRKQNSTFKKNYVYKTHDYPPKSLPANVKLIFMFGNPMDTAISSHRRINEWGKLHHEHLGSDLFRPNDDVLHFDTLKLDCLFDAWNRKQNFDFLSIRYETLYSKETIDAISDYLGLKFTLLPEKKRKTDWKQHPMKEELLSVYGSLNRKIIQSANYSRRMKK